jgi:hypothetical protein
VRSHLRANALIGAQHHERGPLNVSTQRIVFSTLALQHMLP